MNFSPFPQHSSRKRSRSPNNYKRPRSPYQERSRAGLDGRAAGGPRHWQQQPTLNHSQRNANHTENSDKLDYQTQVLISECTEKLANFEHCRILEETCWKLHLYDLQHLILKAHFIQSRLPFIFITKSMQSYQTEISL